MLCHDYDGLDLGLLFFFSGQVSSRKAEPCWFASLLIILAACPFRSLNFHVCGECYGVSTQHSSCCAGLFGFFLLRHTHMSRVDCAGPTEPICRTA